MNKRAYFGTRRELEAAGATLHRLQIDLPEDELERWNYLKRHLQFTNSRDFLNELCRMLLKNLEDIPKKDEENLLSF